MTFVTECTTLFRGVELILQQLEIGDDNVAAGEFNDAFGLKAGKISGDEFADSADLRCQFLIAGRQLDLDSFGRTLAFLGQAEEKGRNAAAHRGEGKLFDNADEPSQTSSHDAQNFQCDLRVS